MPSGHHREPHLCKRDSDSDTSQNQKDYEQTAKSSALRRPQWRRHPRQWPRQPPASLNSFYTIQTGRKMPRTPTRFHCVCLPSVVSIQVSSKQGSTQQAGSSRPTAPAAARATVTGQRQRHPREGLCPAPAPAVWTTGGVQNQGSHRWSFQSVTPHATSFCRCPVTPLSKKQISTRA